MKVVNKVKEEVKKHKTDIAITCGWILMNAASFWLGAKYTSARVTCGINKMWEADPELKERMWDAIGKAKGFKP